METITESGLNLGKLQSLDEEYTQTLKDYFEPLLPYGCALRTQHSTGDVIVHKWGGATFIKFHGNGGFTFLSTGDIKADDTLLKLASKINEHFEYLTKYKLAIGVNG